MVEGNILKPSPTNGVKTLEVKPFFVNGEPIYKRLVDKNNPTPSSLKRRGFETKTVNLPDNQILKLSLLEEVLFQVLLKANIEKRVPTREELINVLKDSEGLKCKPWTRVVRVTQRIRGKIKSQRINNWTIKFIKQKKDDNTFQLLETANDPQIRPNVERKDSFRSRSKFTITDKHESTEAEIEKGLKERAERGTDELKTRTAILALVRYKNTEPESPYETLLDLVQGNKDFLKKEGISFDIEALDFILDSLKKSTLIVAGKLIPGESYLTEAEKILYRMLRNINRSGITPEELSEGINKHFSAFSQKTTESNLSFQTHSNEPEINGIQHPATIDIKNQEDERERKQTGPILAPNEVLEFLLEKFIPKINDTTAKEILRLIALAQKSSNLNNGQINEKVNLKENLEKLDIDKNKKIMWQKIRQIAFSLRLDLKKIGLDIKMTDFEISANDTNPSINSFAIIRRPTASKEI